MTAKFRDENAELIRHGGGRNSRSSEDQINPLECTDGENFLLDPGNGEFRPRPPFDLLSTVPNGGEIRGFATLLKADGTVTMLVQGGANVYKWDGFIFTQVGTVSATAQLRGPKESIWQLADKVLIADLNQIDNIKEWDGTTFSETSFFEVDGSTAFPNFKARYILVENERAFYGNIKDGGGVFEHLLVSSQRGDYTIVSNSLRPASALSEADPWFLPVPQLKPINGLQFAFGILAVSQANGAFEKLTGATAKDFALVKLHDGSGAAGRESVVSTGNDIIYGAPGHIESLEAVDKFGDVEFDDLSFKIKPDIEDIVSWTLIFNQRLKRIYCFPSGKTEAHVLFTDFKGTQLSPWSKYITKHPLGFQPSATMTCRDPVDSLEYVFMGDSFGNLYRMEGTGLLGDSGTTNIAARRVSKLNSMPVDAKMFNGSGWIQHRKNLANTANLKFIFSGEHVHDVLKTVPLSAVSFDTVYNGSEHYGGAHYYSPTHENRLIRRKFGFPAFANQYQVETEIDSVNDFAITETGLRYDFAG